MMTLDQYFDEQMKDPEFVKAYKGLQPEMAIIQAMIDARETSHLTQKELSERTGISQAEISRIENGNRNPSIKLLQRLAEGMGMELKISFVPQT